MICVFNCVCVYVCVCVFLHSHMHMLTATDVNEVM